MTTTPTTTTNTTTEQEQQKPTSNDDNNSVTPCAMSVLGPVQGIDLGIVLMNEPLLCTSMKNPLFQTAPPPPQQQQQDDKPSTDNITLQPQQATLMAQIGDNLTAVRADPFSFVDNMTLSSLNDATEEVMHLLTRQQKPISLLYSASVDQGRDFERVQVLAKRLMSSSTTARNSKIHIIMGTTPKVSTTTATEQQQQQQLSKQNDLEASKQDVERMEKELLYGIPLNEQDEKDTTIDESLCIRAGFLGELTLSDEMTASDIRRLKACAVVQHTTKAPLLLDVSARHVMQALNDIETCGGDLSKTILTHADLYYYHRQQQSGSNDLSLLQQLLDRGVGICLDRFSVSSAIWDLDHEYPSVQSVVDCIVRLVQLNPQYIHQIVVSSGIFMKLQYTKYGGVGYNIVPEYLVPRLLKKSSSNLTQSQIDTILQTNPQKWSCWWTPPPPPKKPKEYLPCDVCHKMFEPILGEYYTKYTFTYCGTDCLRKHRMLGFKPLR